jgi:hypothetical protein
MGAHPEPHPGAVAKGDLIDKKSFKKLWTPSDCLNFELRIVIGPSPTERQTHDFPLGRAHSQYTILLMALSGTSRRGKHAVNFYAPGNCITYRLKEHADKHFNRGEGAWKKPSTQFTFQTAIGIQKDDHRLLKGSVM